MPNTTRIRRKVKMNSGLPGNGPGMQVKAIEGNPSLLAYRDTGFAQVQGWCQAETMSILAELAGRLAET